MQNNYQSHIVREVVDDRGFLKEIIVGKWKQINLLYSKRGTVRGHHYHKLTKEFFYVLKGRIDVCLKRLNSPEEINFTVAEDGIFIVPELHYHILTFIDDTTMISGYSLPFDINNPDIYHLADTVVIEREYP